MKLTQSQLSLLRECRESRFGHCGVSTFGGHGSQGGRVSGGGRKRAAGVALANAGLLVFTSSENTTECKNGWTTHIRTVIWTITDAGRTALAECESATPLTGSKP